MRRRVRADWVSAKARAGGTSSTRGFDAATRAHQRRERDRGPQGVSARADRQDAACAALRLTRIDSGGRWMRGCVPDGSAASIPAPSLTATPATSLRS